MEDNVREQPAAPQATKPARVMPLRRADKCAGCEVVLPVGTKARWDPGARTTTCLACCAAPDASTPVPTTLDAPLPALDVGRPGESAQREFQRRKDTRESRVREKHPRLGGLILALSDEPQSTTACTFTRVSRR